MSLSQKSQPQVMMNNLTNFPDGMSGDGQNQVQYTVQDSKSMRSGADDEAIGDGTSIIGNNVVKTVRNLKRMR